jgi:hypothetical protein
MMKRREFIAAAAAFLVSPAVTQETRRRIGLLFVNELPWVSLADLNPVKVGFRLIDLHIH